MGQNASGFLEISHTLSRRIEEDCGWLPVPAAQAKRRHCTCLYFFEFVDGDASPGTAQGHPEHGPVPKRLYPGRGGWSRITRVAARSPRGVL